MKEIIILTSGGALIGVATSDRQAQSLAFEYLRTHSGVNNKVEHTTCLLNTINSPVVCSGLNKGEQICLF